MVLWAVDVPGDRTDLAAKHRSGVTVAVAETFVGNLDASLHGRVEGAGAPALARAVWFGVDDDRAPWVAPVVVPEHHQVEPRLLDHVGCEGVLEGPAVAVFDFVVVAGFFARAVVVLPLVELDRGVDVGGDLHGAAEEDDAGGKECGEVHVGCWCC